MQFEGITEQIKSDHSETQQYFENLWDKSWNVVQIKIIRLMNQMFESIHFRFIN